MTLLIQRSKRRDTLAMHAKLDKLLRSHNEVRSEIADLDDKETENIEQHRKDEQVSEQRRRQRRTRQ